METDLESLREEDVEGLVTPEVKERVFWEPFAAGPLELRERRGGISIRFEWFLKKSMCSLVICITIPKVVLWLLNCVYDEGVKLAQQPSLCRTW